MGIEPSRPSETCISRKSRTITKEREARGRPDIRQKTVQQSIPNSNSVTDDTYSINSTNSVMIRPIVHPSSFSSLPRFVNEHLVGGGGGEGGGGQTEPLVRGVVDRVETLEEGQTVDEVETLAAVGAEVTNDEVDTAGAATNSSVQVTLDDAYLSVLISVYGRGSTHGPDLSVGGQLESLATNGEEQALEVSVLSRGQAQETSVVVSNSTSSLLVLGERIYTAGENRNVSRTLTVSHQKQ